MEYQEAKRIYGEIEYLFESRLHIIKGDFFQNPNLPKINYKRELETIKEVQFSVEQLTNSLLKLYLKNPLVQSYIFDLFRLNSYCLQYTYEVHQNARQYTVTIKLQWNRHKMHYLFELFAAFTKFDAFLKMYVLPVSMGNVPLPSPTFHLPEAEKTSSNQQLSSQNTAEEELEKATLPKQIALMDALGTLENKDLQQLPKTDQRDIIRFLLGHSDRGIKGNISVLNPKSHDNRSHYTSYQHQDWAKKVLSGKIKLTKPKNQA